MSDWNQKLAFAKKHSILLCQKCHIPLAVHVGYDHGKGQCTIDRTGQIVRLNGRLSKTEQNDLLKRLRTYAEEVRAIE